MAKRGRPFKVHAPVMASHPVKIVWLGEGDVLETEWNDVAFRAGVPVEISDPYMIGKARGNPFFEVIDG